MRSGGVEGWLVPCSRGDYTQPTEVEVVAGVDLEWAGSGTEGVAGASGLMYVVSTGVVGYTLPMAVGDLRGVTVRVEENGEQ